MKMVGREEVKVQPTASEKYAPIVQALRSEGSAFQTYKRKPDRNFRVVLRHVHPSTDPEEIVAELKRYGHSVVRMANLGRQEGSGPSPIFLLELEPRANNSEVFRVNRLLNRTVRFEPPHKRWDLRQCGLCQNFGHPREFCDRSPKPSGAACPRKEGTGGNQPVPGPSTRPDNSQTGNPGTCDLTKLEEGMRGILARLDSLLGLFSVLVGRTN
ncbi:UNVERIFIED_CONTAM: hypothetical protein PYX00_004587 [Menopon gallinae]|uniref:Pre-C2HC domain-containing protein n=1 Tax=Menopon gallinae TaxID=328185 RepID=A0AAW2I6A8_9NEOP